MHKIFQVFVFAWMTLCASCATAPRELPPKQQETKAVILPPLPCVREIDWLGRMQSFLQGKLPEPPNNKRNCGQPLGPMKPAEALSNQ